MARYRVELAQVGTIVEQVTRSKVHFGVGPLSASAPVQDIVSQLALAGCTAAGARRGGGHPFLLVPLPKRGMCKSLRETSLAKLQLKAKTAL